MIDTKLTASAENSGDDSKTLDNTPGTARKTGHAKRIFCIWMIIFGTVGAQMGWILRPFIGSPRLPIELFRERESNFFEALFRRRCPEIEQRMAHIYL